MTKTNLSEIRDRCKVALPFPSLLHTLGMGEHAKSSCRSPLRKDKSPSWGIFRKGERWFFKDQATGEAGDELAFLALLKGLDCRTQFRQVLDEYSRLAGLGSLSEAPTRPFVFREKPKTPAPIAAQKPDRTGFSKGTRRQLEALAKLRGIGLPGLQLASERGLLVFGKCCGFECWAVTDSACRIIEARRLDGKLFPAIGDLHERKSHALRNSQKAWPVGILEAASFPKIALVEGMPDFLEAHYLTLWEGKPDVTPVAILAASPMIMDEALEHFRNKRVRIFPHAERHGAKGALRWATQLRSVGAVVDCFDFAGLKQRDGSPVNDLLDFSNLHPDEILTNQAPTTILP